MPWRRKCSVMPTRLSGRYLPSEEGHVSWKSGKHNVSDLRWNPLVYVKQAAVQPVFHQRPQDDSTEPV